MTRSFLALAGALALSSSVTGAVVPPQGQVPLSLARKPLVSSEALQAKINGGSLMKRATHLYELASTSTDSWGHPTRVIGSKGAARAPHSARQLTRLRRPREHACVHP
jgi:aminopeptidase Y